MQRLDNMAIRKFLFMVMLIAIQDSHELTQGFFSQRISFPRIIVPWNCKPSAVTLTSKFESSVKAPLLNIFGRKNTVIEDKFKKEEAINAANVISNKNIKESPITFDNEDNDSQVSIHENAGDQKDRETQHIKVNDEKNNDELIDFGLIFDVTDNDISSTETTTEIETETTTDDYESTTYNGDLFNRASPHLVASLLG